MKLIDKDKVVAEIEKRIKELRDLFKEDEKKLDSFQKTAIHLCIDECKVVLNILDTLETKDVNLEKELETLDRILYDLDGVAIKGATCYLTVEDVKDIAKRFFELGLNTQKV